MKKIYLVPVILIIGIFLVSKIIKAPNPSRDPEPGCKWEKVIGAGLEVWGQRCGEGNNQQWVGVSETLPGVLEEFRDETGKVVSGRFIQVFELKNQKIEDVIPLLPKNEDWKDSDLCTFKKVLGRTRTGVTAYILMPTGAALEKFEKEGQEYPIVTTCGGFGAGNSGNLWFEIHSSNPNKAIFFSMSQDSPLYDESTVIVK